MFTQKFNTNPGCGGCDGGCYVVGWVLGHFVRFDPLLLRSHFRHLLGRKIPTCMSRFVKCQRNKMKTHLGRVVFYFFSEQNFNCCLRWNLIFHGLTFEVTY